jgi:hypothetical protein
MERVSLNKLDIGIEYFFLENVFDNNQSLIDNVKYMKGIYQNIERFKSRFFNRAIEAIQEAETFKLTKDELEKALNNFQTLLETYKSVEPFNYLEAFNIKDNNFRALVFRSVNISDMINNLGAVRYKTDGIKLNLKTYDIFGNENGTIEQDNIYEVYEVDGTKLNIEEKLYVVKCWCTTTNKEHWLWIESEYKDDPLSAIASTFRVHENVVDNIRSIKRQGDILILEMKDEKIVPTGDIVSLTKEQYFQLLEAQS